MTQIQIWGSLLLFMHLERYTLYVTRYDVGDLDLDLDVDKPTRYVGLG